MEYKLIALDVDGTLFNSKREVTQPVLAAIAAAKVKGVFVVISTGRGYQSAKHVIDLIGAGPYVINYGGAQITDVRTGEIASITTLPAAPLKEAIELARSLGLHIHVYDHIGAFYFDAESEWSKIYSERSLLTGKAVGDLLGHKWDTPKALCVGDPDAIKQAMSLFAERFKDRLRISTSDPCYIEINEPGTNKATALKKIEAMLGIRREEIIAVGDDLIDLEMIAYAGLGVCMANGVAAVKAVADYIAPSNDEDGVAHVIEKFILNG